MLLFLIAFIAIGFVVFGVAFLAFCTVQDFFTSLKLKWFEIPGLCYVVNVLLTLHLKQSGCQSLSNALNLGAEDSPTPGAIGFLQA